MENGLGGEETHRTPPKFLENLPRDIREAVRGRNQGQGSPFCCLPNHTTPPSRYLKIKNPFEAAVNERLHANIFSPSVFAKVEKPRSVEKFKWTIEDVSSLRPAHIDESTIAQFEQPTPEDDDMAQEKIERFFSETHIVPSPWNEDVKTVPLISEGSPVLAEMKDVCESWTQTVLSLPPTLPAELELALRPFFSFTQNQGRDAVDVNSSLYRRLFHSDDESVASLGSASTHTELSDAVESTGACTSDRQRDFDSPTRKASLDPAAGSSAELNECEISPILRGGSLRPHDDSFDARPLSATSPCHPSGGGPLRLNFSHHMSVDTSLNMASENEMHANDSIHSESPLRSTDFMETSFDWDIEYNNVSFDTNAPRRTLFEPTASEAMMDVSTTPKLRCKSSQGKNLSNSFKLNGSDDDDDDSQNARLKCRKVNLFDDKSECGHDTGYSTVGENSADISTQNKENSNPKQLFASTPTKKYFVSAVRKLLDN